ncbi:hypothetical protein GCM10010954_03950 [Halobacillus andaensis]|uniref:YxiS n=1 Tax=Halobacillus andaensis TaxID=1176239 RepID=A0A917B088_HALAA|nr:hypothetical protein [Halobacillus andaensis]MBP2003185.1 type III secretory pathway component EscR [Halobacillus andaensis]GGF08650.1 hypothetical protein GCM10010954_03950 [Halobacillus andaensis]
MEKKEIEERVIQKYRQDEDMMIVIFAQWCINNNLDPIQVYEEAYPHQSKNEKLNEAIEKTAPKNESELISSDALLEILALFENDDLAFKVAEYIEQNRTESDK